MRSNKQLRRLGAALVVLVVIFGVMTATAKQRSEVTFVEKIVATALYPLQVATDWVAGKFRGVGASAKELVSLREENERLRTQVQEMSQSHAKSELLTRENEDLRSELAAKERAKYPLLTAEVISRTSDNWYRLVTINRGSRDGVQQGMAVVNWQGLVGKVSHTTPYTATVQLVIDAGFGQGGFGAGSKIATTGELGVIETVQGGHVRMRFFSSEPSVQVGQAVFTSGLAWLPADLLVGWVDSVDSSEFQKFVNVRPAVDFHKLEVVHVVLTPTENDRGANAP